MRISVFKVTKIFYKYENLEEDREVFFQLLGYLCNSYDV